MNQLSVILYLADVSASLKWFAYAVCILTGAMFVVTLIIMGVATADTDESPNHKTDNDRWINLAWRWCRSVAAFFVLGFVVAGLLPSQQTMMMIAASQFGEQVLMTPQAAQIGGEAGGLATDSMKLLHQYIQQQLAAHVAQTVGGQFGQLGKGGRHGLVDVLGVLDEQPAGCVAGVGTGVVLTGVAQAADPG